MTESVAPKAAQNDDESSEQQDSSERVKIASDARASTHPPPAEDDDWLDDMDTVPAPRESEEAVDEEAVSAAPPSEPIVPSRIVNVAAGNPASLEPRSSAPVIHIAERRRKKKKKARPAAAARPQQKPQPIESNGGFSAGPWLLLAAVAGVAGLWFLTRSGGEESLAKEAPAALTPRVTEAENAAPPIPPSQPAEVEQAAPPPDPAPVTEPEPKAAPAKVETPSETAAEPARIAAFKAVVEASKGARTCRHRGDASGKIPVIVEFGSDGRVQRTDVKAALANPMTSRCIASRLAEATIPAFGGGPILITAEVSLR